MVNGYNYYGNKPHQLKSYMSMVMHPLMTGTALTSTTFEIIDFGQDTAVQGHSLHVHGHWNTPPSERLWATGVERTTLCMISTMKPRHALNTCGWLRTAHFSDIYNNLSWRICNPSWNCYGPQLYSFGSCVHIVLIFLTFAIERRTTTSSWNVWGNWKILCQWDRIGCRRSNN